MAKMDEQEPTDKVFKIIIFVIICTALIAMILFQVLDLGKYLNGSS